MRRHLTPAKIAGAVVFILLVTLGALWLAPSSNYILLPARAAGRPLARPVEHLHPPPRPRAPGCAARACARRPRAARAGRDLLRRRLRAACVGARVALPVDPRGRDARAGQAARSAGR